MRRLMNGLLLIGLVGIAGPLQAADPEPLDTGAPLRLPSKGVAMQTSMSPLSKEIPVMVWVVTEGPPLMSHSQV